MTLRPSTAVTVAVISTAMPSSVGARWRERDVHADRVLAGVGVLEQQVAAGVLDVAQRGPACIDAPFLAHEADRPAAIDHEALHLGGCGPNTILHHGSPAGDG